MEVEENHYQRKNLFAIVKEIYKLRIAWILTILFTFSVLLYISDYIISEQITANPSSATWLVLKNVPIKGLADACFTTLLIGFSYEWFVRKEAEAALILLISNQIKEQNTAILDEIPRALITNTHVMQNTLKKSNLDEIIRAGLQIQLGDSQMGNDIYDGLLRKTLSYEQRRANYRNKITLSTIKDGASYDEIVLHKFYNTTIDIRYETKLTKENFVFHCVDNLEDYNKSVRNPKYDFTYIFPAVKEFPKIDTTVFNVETIKINDLELSMNRQTDNGSSGITITCDHPNIRNFLGQTVEVYYRYTSKINKRGHLFRANVIVPTKNVIIELDYADTDIHYVNVLDFFVSTESPKITYSPSVDYPRKIEVELNEWVFPKGGVVFVWVLSKEMDAFFLQPLPTRKKH